MDIRGFQGNSFIDFPGRLAAIIWTPGCNFRCPYCYNRELVLEPASLEAVAAEGVFAHLEKQRKFIDGLVVTGGEPTLQPGLGDFLARVKDKGLEVKLDTNGARPGVVRSLLKARLVDYFAVDVKAPLDEPGLYGRAAGLPEAEAARVAEKVVESLAAIMSADVEYEFRTTIVPGLVGPAEIERLAASFARCGLPRPRRYCLQNYFAKPGLDPGLVPGKPLKRGELEELRRTISPFFGEVILRGENTG